MPEPRAKKTGDVELIADCTVYRPSEKKGSSVLLQPGDSFYVDKADADRYVEGQKAHRPGNEPSRPMFGGDAHSGPVEIPDGADMHGDDTPMVSDDVSDDDAIGELL